MQQEEWIVVSCQHTSGVSKATVKRQQFAKLERMDWVLLKELGW